MDFYVYVHKKKTTGEVFYVGKGRGRRAWDKHSRSDFWNYVVEKHGLIVEIVAQNLQEWYAYELETELILKYGRSDIGTGTLVNFTDGGEGASGLAQTEYSKELASKRMTGLSNIKADMNIYTFENVHTLEVVTCTRYELEQQVGKTINDLFSTTSFSINGWTIAGRKLKGKPAQDLNHYRFIHKSGDIFEGTRVMFKRKYGHSLKPLFSKTTNHYSNCKGWRLDAILYERKYEIQK